MLIKTPYGYKILNSTTDDSVKEFRNAIGIIDKDKLKKVHIKYDTQKGIGDYDTPTYYPLRFIGDDIEVRVSCVTAGYGGRGPHGTIECLQIAGFNVDKRTKNSYYPAKRWITIFSKILKRQALK